MTEYNFEIPIRLKAMARPRRGKYGQFYSPTRKHTKEIGDFIRKEMDNQEWDRFDDGEIRLDCLVLFKNKRRGDLDNYIASIMNALIGVVYQDDKQVAKVGFEVMDRQKENKILLGVLRYEKEKDSKGTKEEEKE